MGKVKASKRKIGTGKPQGFAALDASNARSLEPLKPTHAPSRGVVSAPAAGTAPAATRAASAKPLTDPEEVWEMVEEDDDWMLIERAHARTSCWDNVAAAVRAPPPEGLASPPARGAARPQTKTPSPASSRAASRMETDEGEAMLSGHKDPSRHAIGKGSRSALQVRARRDKVEKKESAKLAAQEAL